MIKAALTNEVLKYITGIDKNRYEAASVKLPKSVANKLRKNSKKKSSYASTKIEGNPLSEKQVAEVIESDGHRHYLKPEQEVRNYYLALNYLEEKAKKKEKFSGKLILDVQKLVEKGAPGEKIGFRGQTPPGVLFAVYDSDSVNPDYIPPEYKDIPGLLDELITYVNTTDDHPLIVAAIVHYQLVTIHPFEDGNGRTARLLSGYILDINGYGFNGIGSLEEYFAYDIQEYYDSIEKCHVNGNSNVFIEFMLNMINQILNDVIEQSVNNASVSQYVKRLINCMEYDVPYTANEIMEKLGLKSKETLRKNYLDPAINMGLVEMTIPDKPNSRNQRYIRK